jgi:ribulose-phosphate 3-epimerase
VDVMDGHFVPNLTIGPPVIRSLRKHTELYFDCHLMIQHPGDYLEALKHAGADGCTVHLEVGRTRELIEQMRELGLDVGLAVNPDSPFEAYEEYLDKVDMVLVMTIFPGFGGQAFMQDVMPKLAATRKAIDERGLDVRIEVDGGIDAHTGPVACEHGADTFVAGTAIFGQRDPLDAAQQLREAIEVIERARQ